MEVEVRVVRTRVWLSSSQFLNQDGLLSLTRVGEIESVAHATLRSVQGKNGDQCSLEEMTRQQGQHKRFCTVTATWEDLGIAPASNCPKFSLPEELAQTSIKKKTNQQANLPRLDFQLFLLRPRSRGGTSARSGPTTVYLGTSGWQLSEKDVEALVSSREVVFLTTLQDDLGTLEVKLRYVSSNDPSRSQTKGLAAENDTEAPAGFTINWSSSEALQKDLAEKTRQKAEADKKLIAQLKQTASKAAKLLETRDLLLVLLYRSRAASRIQRQFRLLQCKKQAIITKLREEEEERIAAKKGKSGINPEDSPSYQESKRIAEHMETERTKLKQRLAVLEMQRQRLVTSQRVSALRSTQNPLYQRNDKLFDDELLHAVQELHFTRTNFVCSANLGMRFDLTNLLVKSHRRAELVPKKNCILMKLHNPKATAMLFANGKLVCTGADTEEAIKNVARRFTQVIQKMDFPGVNLIDFKIQNVVGTCDLGFRVLVEALAFAHSDRCTYEPELYPALIYRLEKPQVKVLVFVSGKVVFTDSKEPRELYAACEAIFPVLSQFKDPKPVDPSSVATNDGLSRPHLKMDTSDESHLDD
ncbi:Beta2-adaptin/TBP, C-terminal domain [Phytophthora cactorum]|nr:Beta2-adaptin/TBP, C-terminal domain [Phytophthora cactorum]